MAEQQAFYDSIHDSIRLRLKKERLKRGLTYRALAKKIDCSSSTLHKWESGANTPSFKHMLIWCHVLDVKIFIQFEEDPTTVTM